MPVALTAVFASVALAQPSREDRDAARALFQEGVAAAAAGDFRAALDAFRGSYDLNPRAVVLINIGSCLMELGDARAALEAFREYLRVGVDEPSERRAQVQAQIDTIELSHTFVRIDVSEPGAVVLVDGRAVGTSPLAEPIGVQSGIVEIRARKEGFDEAVTMVTVVAGETTPVHVSMAPSAPPVEPQPGEEPQPPDQESIWTNPWFWGGIGAGVIAVVVTATALAWPADEAEPSADWVVWGR